MTLSDENFGLEDWPLGGVSRRHAIHVAYSRAARRASGTLGTYVDIGDVAERDSWTCCECEQAVPPRWTAGQLDQAPVLAFTVPLAEGGRYREANVRLIHLGCYRFADRQLERALRRTLTGVPTVKTRATGQDTHCINGHELAGANLLRAGDGRRRCRQCRNDREARLAAST